MRISIIASDVVYTPPPRSARRSIYAFINALIGALSCSCSCLFASSGNDDAGPASPVLMPSMADLSPEEHAIAILQRAAAAASPLIVYVGGQFSGGKSVLLNAVQVPADEPWTVIDSPGLGTPDSPEAALADRAAGRERELYLAQLRPNEFLHARIAARQLVIVDDERAPDLTAPCRPGGLLRCPRLLAAEDLP